MPELAGWLAGRLVGWFHFVLFGWLLFDYSSKLNVVLRRMYNVWVVVVIITMSKWLTFQLTFQCPSVMVSDVFVVAIQKYTNKYSYTTTMFDICEGVKLVRQPRVLFSFVCCGWWRQWWRWWSSSWWWWWWLIVEYLYSWVLCSAFISMCGFLFGLTFYH